MADKTPPPAKRSFQEELLTRIKEVVDREISYPILNSISFDQIASLMYSFSFVAMRISEETIIAHDKDHNLHGNEIEHKQLKSLFLGYLNKMMQSALFISGATDYLGAMVILRCIFEQIISINTEATGGMSRRIDTITYLSPQERKTIKELWNDLSAWSHPFGKWKKNVCPKQYGAGRIHNPNLFNKLLSHANAILDFIITTTIEKFNISSANYYDLLTKELGAAHTQFLKYYPMFLARTAKNEDES